MPERDYWMELPDRRDEQRDLDRCLSDSDATTRRAQQQMQIDVRCLDLARAEHSPPSEQLDQVVAVAVAELTAHFREPWIVLPLFREHADLLEHCTWHDAEGVAKLKAVLDRIERESSWSPRSLELVARVRTTLEGYRA